MNQNFYARGAYGREANRNHWDEGKDFQCLATGQYFSNRDVETLAKQGYSNIVFLNSKAMREFVVSLNNA